MKLGHKLMVSRNLQSYIIFKKIDGGVDKGDVSSGYGQMNIHTDLQQNFSYIFKGIITL